MDTTNWVVVRAGMEPYEIPHAEVEAHLKSHGECVHLVPTRVWRHYETSKKTLEASRAELRTYRRAAMVVGVR